jgi:hypothetical protein
MPFALESATEQPPVTKEKREEKKERLASFSSP